MQSLTVPKQGPAALSSDDTPCLPPQSKTSCYFTLKFTGKQQERQRVLLHLQELNVKLSKMSRQLEALQAALDASQSKAGGGSATATSANGQQHKAESDDEQTQAERKERFGEDS